MGLEKFDQLEVVGEASDGIEAIAEVERLRPDVALLDAKLPNCDGIRAAALIRDRVPNCATAILTAEPDNDSLVDALEAGASGYLSKTSPLSELVDLALGINDGETIVPREMLGPLLDRLLSRRKTEDEAYRRIQKLTRREREVLMRLGQGKDNNSIAQDLVISPQTARTHIQNILTKLGFHSRLEAAAFVIQNDILDELAGAP